MLSLRYPSFMLSGGWTTFTGNLDSFFGEGGMVGKGVPAIGTSMMAIGLFAAGILFVMHKINQQSSLPRPGGFVLVALVGAILKEHQLLIGLVEKAKDILFGWFSL